MRILVYSTQRFDREFLTNANAGQHQLSYTDSKLSAENTDLAAGFEGVCLFVNDQGSREVLSKLSELGIKLIVLRSAGYNHIDLEAAEELGLTVMRVPGYSPHAVAEHTIALILTLNRKVHRAFNRVREQNFSLDGLLGFDLYNKTCGVIGTGKIGRAVIDILLGFGCKVIANDLTEDLSIISRGVDFKALDELFSICDIVTLHCPLNPETYHLINADSLELMKKGVMLINTGRGGLVDTNAVIPALKSGKIGYLGLDVYEEEGDLFFRDLSQEGLKDDLFVRLMTFPNVLITAHQAFFTKEALSKIAETTIGNIGAFARGELIIENLVSARSHLRR